MNSPANIRVRRDEFDVEYWDADSFNHLPLLQCTQAYGVCYAGDDIVLCQEPGGTRVLPGGKREAGESLEDALHREVAEETNMRVIACSPIGYQEVRSAGREPIFQVRYVAIVEPIGPFVADADGYIIGIELVPEADAPTRLGWEAIGKRLIQRASLKRANLLT